MTPRRVLIATDEVGWHTRQLQAALRARGARGHCVDLERCTIDTTRRHGLGLPGFGDTLPDAVLVRGIAGGRFEQVTKRLAVLHALREWGVPVVNDARAVERAVDKATTSLLLHRHGVATPPAWAIESEADARAFVDREAAAGRTLVLKPLFGSQGKGVRRVGHVDGRRVALPRLTTDALGGLAYLQRFVPRPPDVAREAAFDWRVFVVGGVARAAMRRVSRHWVHNLAQGARSVAHDLDADPALARLAEAAAAALGLDVAGVDVMPSADAAQPRVVIEVNGVAAWHGLQQVTRWNIAQAIVDDLLDRRLAQDGPPSPRTLA